MDGRCRVFDNIFIERLWRTVKYEEVYIHSHKTAREAREGLERYFRFYNTERLHKALGYRTPEEVYLDEALAKVVSLSPAAEREVFITHRCRKISPSGRNDIYRHFHTFARGSDKRQLLMK